MVRPDPSLRPPRFIYALLDAGETTATFTFTVTPIDDDPPLGVTISETELVLDEGDNAVNIAEKAAGFTIGGDTGSQGGEDVEVDASKIGYNLAHGDAVAGGGPDRAGGTHGHGRRQYGVGDREGSGQRG